MRSGAKMMHGRSDMDGRGDTNGTKDAPTVEADDAVDQRLGETVRLLRQRAGLSIQDVATKTGLSTGMISQLERARAMPSIRTLRLLSIALEVPISYFFETSDPAEMQRYIVRKGSRRLLRLTASGVVKEALTPEGKGQLEALRGSRSIPAPPPAPTSCSTPARRRGTSSRAACGCGSTTRPMCWKPATVSAFRASCRTCSTTRPSRRRA